MRHKWGSPCEASHRRRSGCGFPCRFSSLRFYGGHLAPNLASQRWSMNFVSDFVSQRASDSDVDHRGRLHARMSYRWTGLSRRSRRQELQRHRRDIGAGAQGSGNRVPAETPSTLARKSMKKLALGAIRVVVEHPRDCAAWHGRQVPRPPVAFDKATKGPARKRGYCCRRAGMGMGIL